MPHGCFWSKDCHCDWNESALLLAAATLSFYSLEHQHADFAQMHYADPMYSWQL